jgi:hypothetical protein
MEKTNQLIMAIFIIIIVIIVAIIIEKTISKDEEENLFERLNSFSQLKGKEPLEITKLTQEEIDIKSQQYPVIYSDAKEGDYLIKYENLLVLYDYQNNEIKKEFNLQSITIG